MNHRVRALRSPLLVGAVVMAMLAVIVPTSVLAATTVTIDGPTAADWVTSGAGQGVGVTLQAIPANEAAHNYSGSGADPIFDAPDRDSICCPLDTPFGIGVDNALIQNGDPGVTSHPSEIGYYGNADICGTGKVLGANCADELRVKLDKALHGGNFEVTFFYGGEQSGEQLRAQLYLGGSLVDNTVYGPVATGAYDGTNPGRWTFNLPNLNWDEIRFIGYNSDVADATDFLVESISGDLPENSTLTVVKFYDANANGIKDGTEPFLSGWKINIAGPSYTPAQNFTTKFGPTVVDPGSYTVTEQNPIQAGWFHTTANPVVETVDPGEAASVAFGNVCVGAGGGLTLGFWSNKNGQALFGADDLALMVSLNLRNADGTNFNPASYTAFRTWLLGASATNMAYMLSAQLAAMELNVNNGKVSGSALIYAPGTLSANAAGFATVNAVMTEANTELGLHGLTKSGSAFRTYQEALKNALDNANNNLTFAQATPCGFTFRGPVCDAAASGDSNAAYNDIPKDVVDCGPPSEAFEAQSASEFGDQVTLGKTGALQSLSVVFNSYACQDHPLWNNSQCTTTNNSATFSHTITAHIYGPSIGGVPGALLASSTQTFNIPFRPSADTTNCGATGAFLNPVSGNCEFSKKVVLTFTNWSANPALSGNVIWTVAYNTTHYGYSPIGEGAACFTSTAGCPYDSLNVGVKTFAGAPYAGSFANASDAFLNSSWTGAYCDNGVGGTGTLRQDASCWTGYQPLGKIVLAP